MLLPAWLRVGGNKFPAYPGGIAAGAVGGSVRSRLCLFILIPSVGGSRVRSCGRTHSLTRKRVVLGGAPILRGNTGAFGNGVAQVHWEILSTLASERVVCRSSTKQDTRNRAAIKPAR